MYRGNGYARDNTGPVFYAIPFEASTDGEEDTVESRYQATTSDDVADWEDLVFAAVAR
jgi:hypothetical protein